MIVGIPGTGIGGLFYLMGALWLPVRGVFRRLRGESVRWSSTFRQSAMALDILVGLWFTGALLGIAVAHTFPSVISVPTGQGHGDPHPSHAVNLFRAASLFLGAATLVAVLIGVQIARLVFGRDLPAARRR